MLRASIRPSTLEGVKTLAAQIKKERGIKHCSALDIAAVAARCSNFTHATRVLPSREQQQTLRVFLSRYWHDERSHRVGRETLQVELSKPILHVCTKSELRQSRGFGSMRMVAEDHFVGDMIDDTQERAQENICKAVRSLRFMEHTGLRPSRDHLAAYPDRSPHSALPQMDHATRWYDPVTGQFVLVDEPYRGVSETERSEWSRTYGWHLAKSAWPGMYYPNRCELYVATTADANFDFSGLMRRIDAIPAPLVLKDWDGDTGNFYDIFVSPAAKTKQDFRRARSKGTVIPQATTTTIPYTQMFGAQNRRPAGFMPISEHIEIGRFIKAVLFSRARPWGAYQRMNSLRSTLEDWMALEIGKSDLDGPEFFDVYYHDLEEADPLRDTACTSKGVVDIIDEIAGRLRKAYPNCAPLRRELNKLEVSKALTMRAKNLD
jgi:hypothetical protein